MSEKKEMQKTDKNYKICRDFFKSQMSLLILKPTEETVNQVMDNFKANSLLRHCFPAFENELIVSQDLSNMIKKQPSELEEYALDLKIKYFFS